jgi:hypothetical protein
VSDKICKFEDCDKILRSNNKYNYCRKHASKCPEIIQYKKQNYLKNKERNQPKKQEYYQLYKEEINTKRRVKIKKDKNIRKYYKNTPCKIEGCTKYVIYVKHMMCSNHYKKWHRETNEEHYKKVKTKWNEENKESIALAKKIYREDNKSHIKIKRKIYYEKNKKEIIEYIKNFSKTNLNYKISKILRSRLYTAIKKNYKAGSAVNDLGCSIEEFKFYIESKFQPNMSWDNYGFYGWHIDHIVPLAYFNLSNREEFLKAVHYTNLQPLWAEENWSKNKRVINE